MTGTHPLPRTLVTASAGSGKTYRLATEIISLLARGAEPGSILASTFTRKAAGEILERVLLRLADAALDEEKARALAKDTKERALQDSAHCQAILQALLNQLHQLNVSTLDAFFVRVVRSFFHTLGLPPNWTLADPERESQLQEETLVHLLGTLRGDGGETLLLRLFGGQYRRDVHGQLKEGMDELLHLAQWHVAEQPGLWDLLLEDVEALGADELRSRRETLLDEIQGLELPLTKEGLPRKDWEKAQQELLRALAEEQWDQVLSKGILGGVLKDPAAPSYCRIPLEPTWIRAAEEARRLGRAALAPGLRQKLQALRILAAHLEDAYKTTQSRLGVLRFEDVTRLLGNPDLLTDASELYYRLDQDIQHILLDEFQDTSRIQWAALEPLAAELLSGYEGTRAAIFVADPKQSIYGWRKASPDLVHQVGAHYALAPESLTTSWRSSKEILALVEAVFTGIETNPVLQLLPEGPTVAQAWMQDFTTMTAAKPDLPGWVCVHQSPEGSKRALGVEPEILRHAAQTIRAVHLEAPTRSLGVLVRQNRTVAYLMAELKGLGVPVSGEGGAPLTDTVPILALLSLLRMADHPSDRVARYHVIRTPVAQLVGLTTLEDEAAARKVSADIRAHLLNDGYGPTLARWVEALIPSCDAREVARLGQLVELAHRWDAHATLRATDFVRHVETTVVEDPSSAPVRVMTVHKSKGLEFDIVALPDLYQTLSPRRRSLVVAKPSSGGDGVDAFYPSIPSELEPFFPEIAEAKDAAQAPDVRDSLSLLYVALTRPRQALHLFIPRNGGSDRSAARLLASALRIDLEAETKDGLYLCQGEPRWFEAGPLDPEGEIPPQQVEPTDAVDSALAANTEARGAPLLRVAPLQPRRNFPRRRPSQGKEEERGGIDLNLRLHLDGRWARDQGTVVHAWCEATSWLEDGLPEDAALLMMARGHVPEMTAEDVRSLLITFRRWMAAPRIADALSRNRYLRAYPDAQLEVQMEFPFLRLADGSLQEGFVDRLVLVWSEGKVVAAEVLDFKTDRISADNQEARTAALAERTERYRSQITAYCAVIQERFALSVGQVRGTLLFLEAGEEVAVV